MSDKLADDLVLAYILMPKKQDALTEFEKLLNCFTTADVGQYFFIPASAIIELHRDGEKPELELVGPFGHGPFRYQIVDDELMRKIKYRFERIGVEDIFSDLQKFLSCIAVRKELYRITLIDFDKLGFKGHQAPIPERMMQYYFDELSEALFEDFWQLHAESQYLGVAAGAPLLDRTSLESLPGTGQLSIFWGFNLLAGKGMVSLITEEPHHKGALNLRIYSLHKELAKAKERIDLEIVNEYGAGPHAVYGSLMKFGRLVTRSSELEQRGHTEESFMLLMVAIESLLAERESIAGSLSKRAAAISSISSDERFEELVNSIAGLYDARSKFIHEGAPIAMDLLRALQSLSRTVFFAAYRSQTRCLRAGITENDWKCKWTAALDYIAGALDVGVIVDPEVAKMAGIRSRIHPQSG